MGGTYTMFHPTRTPQSIFSNPEKWKEKLRRQFTTDMTNMMDDPYRRAGCAQSIVRSQVFEWITLLVVFGNAIWIGIESQYNDKKVLFEADLVFQIGEHAFCVYFSMELILRLLAFRSVRFIPRDAWFLFDAVLVVLMIAETWLLTLVVGVSGSPREGTTTNTFLRLVKLLRLSRIARVARLLRASPEVLIMLKGMLAALKSVLFTMLLILTIIYVFGIILKEVAEGTAAGAKYFSSVGMAMYSLTIHATLLDGPSSVLDALAEDYFAMVVFFLVIFLSALLMLNLLIGILCEVVSTVSAVEKENLERRLVMDKVWTVFEENGIDLDDNGLISKHELVRVLDNEEATRNLQEAGVDVSGLVDFAEVIFQSDRAGREYEKQLGFFDFMKLLLQLRGTNTATVKDMVDLRKFMNSRATHATNQMERIEGRLKHVERIMLRMRPPFSGQHQHAAGEPPTEPETPPQIAESPAARVTSWRGTAFSQQLQACLLEMEENYAALHDKLLALKAQSDASEKAFWRPMDEPRPRQRWVCARWQGCWQRRWQRRCCASGRIHSSSHSEGDQTALSNDGQERPLRGAGSPPPGPGSNRFEQPRQSCSATTKLSTSTSEGSCVPCGGDLPNVPDKMYRRERSTLE